MYREFYGLKEKPFVLTPDPQFLYLGEGHQTAIESLVYGIQQREGFMVVVGDIGTGKTTICRALLGKLNAEVKAAVIFNSFLSEEELLESILQEYGFPSKGRTRKERLDALNKLLVHYLSQNKNAILIIDEAQNLSIPVLEQIRMLSNLETEKEKILQIILVGQLELNQKLQSPELKQLNQRIAIRYHLLPLTRTETESYIYQRLEVAQSNGTITFSKSALDEIYKFSKGIPRLINLLCDRSLLGGFVDQTFTIDRRIVNKARRSLSGKEGRSAPSRAWALLRFITPARLILFTILLLLAGMLVMIQSHSHFSETLPTIASDQARLRDFQKPLWGKQPLDFSKAKTSDMPFNRPKALGPLDGPSLDTEGASPLSPKGSSLAPPNREEERLGGK
ncbi:MAG: ExeA family protein [Thermodesulfobacteriota bacterium]